MAEWVTGAVGWALPWWLVMASTAWRWRGSPSLDDVSPEIPPHPPRVSVIVPARDEARNIGDCVRSILASTWPALEVIVVDDHSSDGTGELARAAAPADPRLTITTPPPLPPGWLGKQWACAHGATHATGALLLFTDADVRHGSTLHARIAATVASTHADLVSVAGHQEALSFWERVTQPFVFSILAMRYGGAGAVNRSPRATDKIANGQCLVFTRRAYDTFGGHASVRDHAAEDLAFAQRMFRGGYRTHLTLGTAHMSTRMYASLREIVDGWGKNVYAAGRDALPGGSAGRALARILVPFPALAALAPWLALGSWIAGTRNDALLGFGVAVVVSQFLWSAATMRYFRIPIVYALAYPAGALVYLYLAVRAVARGRRIEWKGREYDTPAG